MLFVKCIYVPIQFTLLYFKVSRKVQRFLCSLFFSIFPCILKFSEKKRQNFQKFPNANLNFFSPEVHYQDCSLMRYIAHDSHKM